MARGARGRDREVGPYPTRRSLKRACTRVLDALKRAYPRILIFSFSLDVLQGDKHFLFELFYSEVNLERTLRDFFLTAIRNGRMESNPFTGIQHDATSRELQGNATDVYKV